MKSQPYLKELRRKLRWKLSPQEVQDIMQDFQEFFTAAGAEENQEDAEREAVQRFGPPDQAAAELLSERKLYQWITCRLWLAVPAAVLLAYYFVHTKFSLELFYKSFFRLGWWQVPVLSGFLFLWAWAWSRRQKGNGRSCPKRFLTAGGICGGTALAGIAGSMGMLTGFLQNLAAASPTDFIGLKTVLDLSALLLITALLIGAAHINSLKYWLIPPFLVLCGGLCYLTQVAYDLYRMDPTDPVSRTLGSENLLGRYPREMGLSLSVALVSLLAIGIWRRLGKRKAGPKHG